jgi:hypothetical protein
MAKTLGQDTVEKYCGILLEETEITDVYVGSPPVCTRWGPIAEAPEIKELVLGLELAEDDDFLWDTHGHIVYLRELPIGRWQITYTAGYEEAPDELTELVGAIEADLAASKYANANSPDMLSRVHKLALDLWRRL